MTKHISLEDLELLNRRELRGEKLIAALEHIEKCDACRTKIKLPAKQEILNRFVADEPKGSELKSSSQRESSNRISKKAS